MFNKMFVSLDIPRLARELLVVSNAFIKIKSNTDLKVTVFFIQLFV